MTAAAAATHSLPAMASKILVAAAAPPSPAAAVGHLGEFLLVFAALCSLGESSFSAARFSPIPVVLPSCPDYRALLGIFNLLTHACHGFSKTFVPGTSPGEGASLTY